MKKLLCSFLAFSFLTFAIPAKKAEAGFMILGAVQEFVWDSRYEKVDDVLVVALPVTLITFSLFAVAIPGDPFNNFTLIAGAVCLDEKLEGKKNEIVASLQSRYPFIDNVEVLNQLADKIIVRYPSVKDTHGSAMINFSQKEIDETALVLDLSPGEVNELQSLK